MINRFFIIYIIFVFLIKSFQPFKSKEQGIYYRIIDEYTYFYLKWIEPAKQKLLNFDNGAEYFTQKIGTPEHYSWMGYAFESICYKHMPQIRSALGINSRLTVTRILDLFPTGHRSSTECLMVAGKQG